MLTSDRLKQVLCYDPETGVFTWRVARGSRTAGSVAGYLEADGYWRIYVDSKLYQAQHLAWLFMRGAWSETLLDHKNRVRNDNRWSNIRPATESQNAVNSKTRGRSGIRGVRQRANGNFIATIWTGKKQKTLGTFPSAAEAARVFNKAHQELHGDFSPRA